MEKNFSEDNSFLIKNYWKIIRKFDENMGEILKIGFVLTILMKMTPNEREKEIRKNFFYCLIF